MHHRLLKRVRRSGRRRVALYGFIGCLALGLGSAWFFVWAKSQYGQSEAVSVAQSFLDRLQSGDFAGAHDLTIKSGYVGRSPEALRKFAERQSCLSGRFVWTAPPQTNGNRLRRWIRGEPMDMDEVQVEFEGACLLGVRVRLTTDQRWKVFYFASHAG